jgi:hypothetical protein
VTGAGKEGKLYLVNTTNMGHYNSSSDSQIVQSIQEFPDEYHSTPSYWQGPNGTFVYWWSNSDALKVFQLSNGTFSSSPFATGAFKTGGSGGMMTISANGSASGSGILWANVAQGSNANQSVVPGVLYAYDASNVGTVLWTSLQNQSRDDYGNFAKFTPPTVVNGKVYLATFSSKVMVYGLVNGNATPTSTATPTKTSTPTSTPTSSVSGNSTLVNLSSAFNVTGIYSDGTTFSATGGIDAVGDAYSANLLGTSQSWSGTNFNIGTANQANVVANKVVTLPSGQYSTLEMLASGINGNQASQTVTVTYSDGTTSSFTQGFSDWFTPQNYAGEATAKAMAYRNTSAGTADNRTFNLYGYTFALTSTKTVSSVTLPATNNVAVLAITLISSGTGTATPTFTPTATPTPTPTKGTTATPTTSGSTTLVSSRGRSTRSGSTPTERPSPRAVSTALGPPTPRTCWAQARAGRVRTSTLAPRTRTTWSRTQRLHCQRGSSRL